MRYLASVFDRGALIQGLGVRCSGQWVALKRLRGVSTGAWEP